MCSAVQAAPVAHRSNPWKALVYRTGHMRSSGAEPRTHDSPRRAHLARPTSVGGSVNAKHWSAASRGARASHGNALVVRGEAGVGKNALLDYLFERSADCCVERLAGIESEMELAFAGLHQAVLGHRSKLPDPARRPRYGVELDVRTGDVVPGGTELVVRGRCEPSLGGCGSSTTHPLSVRGRGPERV